MYYTSRVSFFFFSNFVFNSVHSPGDNDVSGVNTTSLLDSTLIVNFLLLYRALLAYNNNNNVSKISSITKLLFIKTFIIRNENG